jgi:hypothetical protein
MGRLWRCQGLNVLPENLPMSAEQRFPHSFTLAAWLIAVLLAIIAGLLAFPRDTQLLSRAFAQQAPMLGARGVYAFPVQLAQNTYGICMLDVDASTVWFYEYIPKTRKLRLASARSWEFDRYLEEYNVEGLEPNQVGELVNKQLSNRRQRSSGGPVAVETRDATQPAPAEDANPPSDSKE